MRKAIVQAIDRKAIIQKVLYGLAVDANTPVLPTTPWSGESKLKGLPYDPKLAESLLDQAGWPKDGAVERRTGSLSR